jgi:plasmid stabilization system protein ParE
VAGTLELVVHPNYIVILEQTLDTVTVLEVLHAAQKYP